MAIFKDIPDKLIWEQYRKDNYLIEIDESSQENRCCIYFSSNGLCYPETKRNFIETIIVNNRFEWYRRRIEHVKKAIFLRDILKNFYVLGINSKYNTLQKLYEFLKQESRGYEVITVGSSAGGYAAVICGLLLSAKTVYDFSGQISLWDYFDFKNKQFLQKNKEDTLFSQYYDLRPFLQENRHTKVICVWAALSREDIFQYKKIENLNREYFISVAIKVHHHGMPMFPESLSYFFDIDAKNSQKYVFEGGGITASFYNAVWWCKYLFPRNISSI